MTDTSGTHEQVDAIVTLIVQAIDALVDDQSIAALECEVQARAAQQALQSIGDYIHPPTGAVANTDEDQGRDAGALLLAAEQQLAQLPPSVRNALAVCAAASYLRRARRALVTA